MTRRLGVRAAGSSINRHLILAVLTRSTDHDDDDDDDNCARRRDAPVARPSPVDLPPTTTIVQRYNRRTGLETGRDKTAMR